MAFREINDLSADTAITLGGFNKKTRKDNPVSIEGYYLGNREVTNKLGTAQLHFFQTPKGNVGVWGKTDLNRKLGGVTVGTMVKAQFDRMAPTPTGEMYKYKVMVDEANMIYVDAPTTVGLDQAEDDGPKYQDENDNAYDEQGADEDFQQQQALQAAEKKAKVQALLSKNKGSKVS